MRTGYRNTEYSFYVGDTLLAADRIGKNKVYYIYNIYYIYNKNFVSEDFYM